MLGMLFFVVSLSISRHIRKFQKTKNNPDQMAWFLKSVKVKPRHCNDDYNYLRCPLNLRKKRKIFFKIAMAALFLLSFAIHRAKGACQIFPTEPVPIELSLIRFIVHQKYISLDIFNKALRNSTGTENVIIPLSISSALS